MKLSEWLLFLTAVALVTAVEVDDKSCDEQLNYFDNALSSREDWAVKRS